jgi:hypothetical protein
MIEFRRPPGKSRDEILADFFKKHRPEPVDVTFRRAANDFWKQHKPDNSFTCFRPKALDASLIRYKPESMEVRLRRAFEAEITRLDRLAGPPIRAVEQSRRRPDWASGPRFRLANGEYWHLRVPTPVIDPDAGPPNLRWLLGPFGDDYEHLLEALSRGDESMVAPALVAMRLESLREEDIQPNGRRVMIWGGVVLSMARLSLQSQYRLSNAEADLLLRRPAAMDGEEYGRLLANLGVVLIEVPCRQYTRLGSALLHREGGEHVQET